MTEYMNPKKKCVHDTISEMKQTSIANVLTVLNNFHKNIELTYKVEENGKIAFLYVLIIGNNEA